MMLRSTTKSFPNNWCIPRLAGVMDDYSLQESHAKHANRFLSRIELCLTNLSKNCFFIYQLGMGMPEKYSKEPP